MTAYRTFGPHPSPAAAPKPAGISVDHIIDTPQNGMYLLLPRAGQRRQCHRRTGIGSALLAVLLLAASGLSLSARPLLDEETEKLLVAAVAAAAELDLYNARCRRDVAGRHADNLNKELVSKFRMTVLEVEDELFPERSYRRTQERLRREFLKKLKQAGGCRDAKRAGIPHWLRNRYDDLLRAIERLP